MGEAKDFRFVIFIIVIKLIKLVLPYALFQAQNAPKYVFVSRISSGPYSATPDSVVGFTRWPGKVRGRKRIGEGKRWEDRQEKEEREIRKQCPIYVEILGSSMNHNACA